MIDSEKVTIDLQVTEQTKPMSGDDYLEFRHWCNLAVGLYNGDVYVLPKDIKCKLVAQTLELKNGGLLDDTDN